MRLIAEKGTAALVNPSTFFVDFYVGQPRPFRCAGRCSINDAQLDVGVVSHLTTFAVVINGTLLC